GDAPFLVAHLPGALGVGGVLHAGIVGCATVVAAQQTGLAELVDVAADGLWRHRELLRQLLDADVAAFAHQFENAQLSWGQVHGRFLVVDGREACRSPAADKRIVRLRTGPGPEGMSEPGLAMDSAACINPRPSRGFG